jgi:DNA-binding beta-propeller fold protein YncE
VRVLRLLSVAVAAALLAAAPASATHPRIDVDVIARGLDNPRHVAVAPDGDVYVAESGRGGDHATSRSCFNSAEGFACTGATGAVTKITRWGQFRVVRGLASFAPVGGGSAIGPHGIYVDGHDLYVTNGGPTAPWRGDDDTQTVLRDPTLVSEERISRLYGTLLKFSKHGHGRLVADLWRFERDVNPDAQIGNPLIDSNPVDVFADHKRTLVADAGGNTVLSVSDRGRVRAVKVFPNIDMPHPFIPGAIVPMQAVPTGVVVGPDGAYYMSQLTGFPFPIGGAKVFRIDPRSGAVTTYASGFTMAMDLAFGRDGTLYVLEIDSDSLLQDGTDGAIWAVPKRGAPRKLALPAGTLTEPGGIAVGHRGDLFVSNRSREAGNGQVLRIDLD